MCLFAICLSLLEPSVHSGLLPNLSLDHSFWGCWVLQVPSGFWILNLSCICHFQIYILPFCKVPFSFAEVSFTGKKLLLLRKAQYLILAFVSPTSGNISRKKLLMTRKLLPVFSSRSVMVSCVILSLSSVLNAQWMYGMKCGPDSLFCMWLSSFPKTRCWRHSLFLTGYTLFRFDRLKLHRDVFFLCS